MKIKQIDGFTMMELLIATGILLGLVGFGTASYVNFNERQVLEQAAKTFKNNLRLAQQNAVTGVKNEDVCTEAGISQPFTGWCVSVDENNTNQYFVYGVCGGGDSTDAITFPGSPDPFPLPSGVTMRVSGARNNNWVSENPQDNRIRFNVFGDGIRMEDLGGALGKVRFCLSTTFSSLTGTVYAIDVKPSGEIEDEGFKNTCFSNDPDERETSTN